MSIFNFKVIDNIAEVTPIVEVIDNFTRNRRLANVFEAKTGNGKLVFSSIDLYNNLDKRPVARQLRNSLSLVFAVHHLIRQQRSLSKKYNQYCKTNLEILSEQLIKTSI